MSRPEQRDKPSSLPRKPHPLESLLLLLCSRASSSSSSIPPLGLKKNSYRFVRFFWLKNRTGTEPKPAGLGRVRFGFGSPFCFLFFSVWLFFLEKNRTEPEIITPSSGWYLGYRSKKDEDFKSLYPEHGISKSTISRLGQEI